MVQIASEIMKPRFAYSAMDPTNREINVKTRKEFPKIKGLCFGCLGRGHLSKECSKKCDKCGKPIQHLYMEIIRLIQTGRSNNKQERKPETRCKPSTAQKPVQKIVNVKLELAQ